MTNFELFADTYRKHLKAFAEKGEYVWYPATDADTVADRMIESFRNGTFNKDGKAIKATCKELGIKHTYIAIRSFINS